MYRTVEDASELSARVIECAGTLFKAHGFKGTTMDDIARELRVSKRTIYALFSSKEEVLREVAWRDTMEAVRVFATTAPSGAPPERMLLALCRYVLTDRAKNGKAGTFSGLYREDAFLREASREGLRRVLVNLYEDGMRHGRLKPAEPGLAGAVLLAMITAATDRFAALANPVKSFNDTLEMIADAVAYRNREPFDMKR